MLCFVPFFIYQNMARSSARRKVRISIARSLCERLRKSISNRVMITISVTRVFIAICLLLAEKVWPLKRALFQALAPADIVNGVIKRNGNFIS